MRMGSERKLKQALHEMCVREVEGGKHADGLTTPHTRIVKGAAEICGGQGLLEGESASNATAAGKGGN